MLFFLHKQGENFAPTADMPEEWEASETNLEPAENAKPIWVAWLEQLRFLSSRDKGSIVISYDFQKKWANCRDCEATL